MGTPQTLVDVRMFFGGCDLTGYSNSVDLSATADEKDRTTFASSGNREVQAGLKGGAFTGGGFWEAGDLAKVDDTAWAEFAGTGTPVSIGPDTADVGDLAWLMKAMESEYKLGGQVGELNPYSVSASSREWPLARGVFLHPAGTARTSTGNGTAVQAGAVTAGRHVYAGLHVLSISGTSTPTITVKVQSDDNSGFSSATDRITFAAATAIGGQYARAAGAITDDYWRATWTISGTSPSFLFVVSLGIA